VFYRILDAITRNRTYGSLVRISAPVVNSVDETLKYEVDFIRLTFDFSSPEGVSLGINNKCSPFSKGGYRGILPPQF